MKNLIKLLCAVVILCLLVSCVLTYRSYRADFYIRQAKLHKKDWPLAGVLLKRGIQLDPVNAKNHDIAGCIYYEKYIDTKEKKYYIVARRLLNHSQKLNPHDSYTLLHMIGLEVTAGKKDTDYVKEMARILIRLDGNNPTMRKYLGLE